MQKVGSNGENCRAQRCTCNVRKMENMKQDIFFCENVKCAKLKNCHTQFDFKARGKSPFVASALHVNFWWDSDNGQDERGATHLKYVKECLWHC